MEAALFTQTYCYPATWCNRHVAAFFETNIFKEVRILCPLSLQKYYNDANAKGSKQNFHLSFLKKNDLLMVLSRAIIKFL